MEKDEEETRGSEDTMIYRDVSFNFAFKSRFGFAVMRPDIFLDIARFLYERIAGCAQSKC